MKSLVKALQMAVKLDAGCQVFIIAISAMVVVGMSLLVLLRNVG